MEKTWKEWLEEQRTKGAMSVKLVSLDSVGGEWGMKDGGKRYGRTDGKYFEMVGVEISNAGREVKSWRQPMLRETGGTGAVVLLKACGEERYLVAAKAEPGNLRPARIMLAAPLQASRANLEQAHGGARPPRAELLDEAGVRWVELPQDGGRFFEKVNAYGVVEVEPEKITLNQNERWFSRDELREALFAGEVNEHLSQALLVAVL
jgi:oxidase EvaA